MNQKLDTFNRLESNVRTYIRSFPAVFSRSRGAQIWGEDGKAYIDFFAGAGALNYGHNNPVLREKLIEYLESDGVVHGLDMATVAKEHFLKTFERIVLQPREMDYVLQFTGPTGANAVEAALKLARKVKQRSNIISFTNGFHGVSTGALAATGNSHFRQGAGIGLGNVTFMPYDGYFGPDVDTIAYLERMLADSASGIDKPAAAIVETVQGEGGVHVASADWLRALEQVCRKHDMLLIVDEIQVGCGRTGRFFGFEESGIKPDIVTLSKSLSAYGLPLAMVMLKPELDRWRPGEHNGTFRGNNLAFVTAAHALESFWRSEGMTELVERKADLIKKWCRTLHSKRPELAVNLRGRGLICGVYLTDTKGLGSEKIGELHKKIARRAFDNGLIVETAGAGDEVIKLLPPLLIDDHLLRQGLQILEDSIVAETRGVMAEHAPFPEIMHS